MTGRSVDEHLTRIVKASAGLGRKRFGSDRKRSGQAVSAGRSALCQIFRAAAASDVLNRRLKRGRDRSMCHNEKKSQMDAYRVLQAVKKTINGSSSR